MDHRESSSIFEAQVVFAMSTGPLGSSCRPAGASARWPAWATDSHDHVYVSSRPNTDDCFRSHGRFLSSWGEGIFQRAQVDHRP